MKVHLLQGENISLHGVCIIIAKVVSFSHRSMKKCGITMILCTG